MIFALRCVSSVMIPAWLPVNDTASTPCSASAMHSRAMVTRSPEVRSMSSSAWRLHGADVAGQPQQVVGGLAHGAHHHHHVGPLAPGPGHVVGDGAHAIGVADRRTAVLLHQERHTSTLPCGPPGAGRRAAVPVADGARPGPGGGPAGRRDPPAGTGPVRSAVPDPPPDDPGLRGRHGGGAAAGPNRAVRSARSGVGPAERQTGPRRRRSEDGRMQRQRRRRRSGGRSPSWCSWASSSASTSPVDGRSPRPSRRRPVAQQNANKAAVAAGCPSNPDTAPTKPKWSRRRP